MVHAATNRLLPQVREFECYEETSEAGMLHLHGSVTWVDPISTLTAEGRLRRANFGVLASVWAQPPVDSVHDSASSRYIAKADAPVLRVRRYAVVCSSSAQVCFSALVCAGLFLCPRPLCLGRS